MICITRTVYFGGLLLWGASSILYPTWVGCLYCQDVNNPQTWRATGVFGLRDAERFTKRALIWNPPQAHSDSIDASVRWPFRHPRQQGHFEILLDWLLWQFCYSLVVMGLVVRVMTWIKRPVKPDRFVAVTWAIALSVFIASLCVLMIAIFSMCYGPPREIAITMVLLGMLCGLIYGLAAFSLRHPQSKLADGESKQGEY